ncbi:MAG: hypothetical protein ABFE07_26445, partial [Armatimonadia bacterium]
MIDITSTSRADALSTLPFSNTAVAKPNVRRAGERFGEAGAEAPSPIKDRRADALVRAGSPDPAVSTGDCPQCPPHVMPQAESNAVVDIGGLSPTT